MKLKLLQLPSKPYTRSGGFLKYVLLLSISLAGCIAEKDNEELTCKSWYHSCNCDYVCASETEYDDYIDSGIGSTCDIDCDSASMQETFGACEVVEDSCTWIE